MVRLAAPVAINRDDSAPDSQTGETAEVLERRIQAEYDEALEQERTGNKAEAQVLRRQNNTLPAHFALFLADQGSLHMLGFVQAAVGRACSAKYHQWERHDAGPCKVSCAEKSGWQSGS